MKIKDLLDANIMNYCFVMVWGVSQHPNDTKPLHKGIMEEIPYYISNYEIATLNENKDDDGMEIVLDGKGVPYLKIVVEDI